MLEKTSNRLKNPENSEYSSPLTIKNVDLLKTLKDLHVFQGKDIEEFIVSCENGELLADLINVLEGKEEKIKGIVKKPKSSTSKSANIVKVLKYLRAFPKMPGTYIWSEKEISEGNLEVIKGLIYDILFFYKKIPAKAPNSVIRNSFLASPGLETNSPRLLIQKQVSPVRNLSSNKRPAKAKLIEPREYREIYAEEMPERVISLSEDSRERISEWLISLDLGHLVVNPSGDFTGDNLRNGIVLCELASLIEGKGPLVQHKTPRSVTEARENIEKAFNVLREHDRGIPVSLLSNPNRIIRGENEAVWGLLCHVMLAYPNLTSLAPKITSKDLPYSSEEIQELEESLLAFILSKGVLDRTRAPATFQELLPDIVSGVLLCDLVARVIDKPIVGVFRAPTTQALALTNIKKALSPLRNLRKMGMKYVWCEEEILKGNLGVILGLLEDLHRFADGIPPRQRGNRYHKDGPYFGKTLSAYMRVNKSHQKLNISISSEIHEKIQYHSPSSKGLLHSNSSVAEYRSSELPVLEENSNFEGFTWLLYIGVNFPQSLNMHLDVIPEFKSGELLCKIIEKLERSPIAGLHPKVNNQAACLHNIGKAFEILRNKPGFPSFLCFVEEEVYKGDGEIIRGVLSEMYKIYRRTINSLKAFIQRRLALE